MTEAEKGACEALIEKVAASKRRLRTCVERWPGCETGEYNPACCRFPKSCSATIYDPDWVSEDDLEPPAEPAVQGDAKLPQNSKLTVGSALGGDDE